MNVTIGHILCGCIWVNKVEMKKPRESRFKWRHDSVLDVIVSCLTERIKDANEQKLVCKSGASKLRRIKFVQEGAIVRARNLQPKAEKQRCILDEACDWEIMSDLPWKRAEGSFFMFPVDVALTNAQPDVIIVSRVKKICVVFELTAPLEENIVSRHTKKMTKYIKEIQDNLQPKWKLEIVCCEVGAKGWIPPGFNKSMKSIFGLVKKKRKKLADDCSWVARQCSYVIWLNKENRDFKPVRISVSEVSVSEEVRAVQMTLSDEKKTDEIEKAEKKTLKPSKLEVTLSIKRNLERKRVREKVKRKTYRSTHLTSVQENHL